MPELPDTDRHLAGILALTAEVLGREVRADENFFAVCDDSLQAIDLLIGLEATLGMEIDVAALFRAKDFRALARDIAGAEAGRGAVR